MRRRSERDGGGPGGTVVRRSLVAGLGLILAMHLGACGGGDDADEPSEATAEEAASVADTSGESTAAGGEGSTTDADADGEGDRVDAATADGPDGDAAVDEALDAVEEMLGEGSATVTFDGETHAFASQADVLDGDCRELFGVLVVDLPLVESNGAAVPEDAGRLRLQVAIDDVPDFEPSGELRLPEGHWYAGADEVAQLSGVETPEITLTVSGTTITGTQAMVPLVSGVVGDLEATIEASCR